MTEITTRVCAAHGVQTRLQCVSCGEPICLRCQVRTEVGLKCERCAATVVPRTAGPSRRVRAAIAVAAGAALVAAAVLFIALRGSSSPVAPATQAPVGHWRTLPNLASLRGATTAVLLPDGRALAVGGGIGAIPLSASEVYDPRAQTWKAAGTLHQARRGNETVLLPGGQALTTGGIASGTVLASAEVWDPATGAWTETAPMHVPRFNHVLVALDDGRVLAAGGTDSSSAATLSSAEVYDPRARTWTLLPAGMQVSRSDASAVRLGDGRVLVAGGFTQPSGGAPSPLSSAELFDPAAGVFTRAGDMREARQDATGTLLGRGACGGCVLVAGGSSSSGAISTAELFDPQRGSWSDAGGMIQPRRLAAASVLPDGSVLVSGGESVQSGSRNSLTSAEIFDPSSLKWRPAAPMTCPRSGQAQVTLPGGGVLVIAGDAAFPGEPPRAQSCTELFTR